MNAQLQAPTTHWKNDLWVCDHHQLNVTVSYIPYLGASSEKIVRPWLTVWQDFHSRKIVGHFIHQSRTVSYDTIFITLYAACDVHGTPKRVHIDDGKNYVDGAIKEFCTPLGIERSLVLGVATKPTERFFQAVDEKFCKTFAAEQALPIKEFSKRFTAWLEASQYAAEVK